MIYLLTDLSAGIGTQSFRPGYMHVYMPLCVWEWVDRSQAAYSKESFSSSSHKSGSLCKPKVIRRASTCSFRGLYSSCSRLVDSSSLLRSFSDCLMVFSIWKIKWVGTDTKIPKFLKRFYNWVDNTTGSRSRPIYVKIPNLPYTLVNHVSTSL